MFLCISVLFMFMWVWNKNSCAANFTIIHWGFANCVQCVHMNICTAKFAKFVATVCALQSSQLCIEGWPGACSLLHMHWRKLDTECQPTSVRFPLSTLCKLTTPHLEFWNSEPTLPAPRHAESKFKYLNYLNLPHSSQYTASPDGAGQNPSIAVISDLIWLWGIHEWTRTMRTIKPVGKGIWTDFTDYSCPKAHGRCPPQSPSCKMDFRKALLCQSLPQPRSLPLVLTLRMVPASKCNPQWS